MRRAGRQSSTHGLEREASGAEEAPASSPPMADDKCEKLQARMVQLRGIFDSLDTEGTGVLNQEQLKEAMNRLGFKCVSHTLLMSSTAAPSESSRVGYAVVGACLCAAFGAYGRTPTPSQEGRPQVFQWSLSLPGGESRML